MLYRRPLFCVLDESTSAMSVEDESMLYELIKQAEITVISISHRPSLRGFHSKTLFLLGDGKWKVE
jgi:ABC-type uncharacterized transport system fused permease/ATPase subunit